MFSILNDVNQHLYNAANERIIERYLMHCKAVRHNDDKTCANLHKAIRSYEVLTDFKNFSDFCPELAAEFLDRLRDLELSKPYLLRLVLDMKHFLRWYALDTNGKHFNANAVEHLNLMQNELNKARASGYQKSHQYKTLFGVINQMPAQTFIQRRNRALFALAVLGSFRSGELRGFRLDSLIFDDYSGAYFIDINPKKISGVKFCTERQATLINRSDLLGYVLDWCAELKEKENFSSFDLMFPSETSRFNNLLMLERKIEKKPMCAASVGKVFKDAFAAAGVEYIKIHNLRHTKARHINELGRADLMVAAKQDFGHKSLSTTYNSYVGDMPHEKQRRLIAGIDFDSI